MSTLFQRVAENLSATYRLKSTLGSGGAAHVYLADDLRRGGCVAIKVLREELAATLSAERFLAEINIAAQLQHTNIVPLYDSGTMEGLPYYVMPFVDGESLRARLHRLWRLSLDEALHICTEVGAALDYAQERRVVHRDIKPENVILYSGRAMVLDFGIALALDAIEYPRRTMPGTVPGTPEYMSPEQAQGATAIDGRSDVYSLACVTYEMICGEPPFTGAPNVVFLQQMSAEPLPLSCWHPWVPKALSAAVSSALAKAPEGRFATARVFIGALRAACRGFEKCRPTVLAGNGRTAERRMITPGEQRQHA